MQFTRTNTSVGGVKIIALCKALGISHHQLISRLVDEFFLEVSRVISSLPEKPKDFKKLSETLGSLKNDNNN